MGWMAPPMYGKSKEFYQNKIDKNVEKMTKLQEEIDFCKEQLKDEK